MIRERFTKVRAELVAIDDELYHSVCLFEQRQANSEPTIEHPIPAPIPKATQEAVTSVGNALRSVISILLRVIDSLP